MGLQKTNHGHIRTRLHKKYLSQVPTPHPPKVIRCTIQSRSETIRGKSEIRERSRRYARNFIRRNKNPATKDRKHPILWDRRLHDVTS